MKRLITAAVYALVFSSSAVLADVVNDETACRDGQLFIGDYPTALSYKWNTMASFPNPSKVAVLQNNWELDCPTYKAVADGKQVVYTSKTNRPEDALYPFRNDWNMFLNGYYKYPALKLDFISFNASLKWDGNQKLTVSGTDTPNLLMGYRLDGGQLLPIAYEGHFTKTELPTSKTIELYIYHPANMDDPEWSYMRYDPSSKSVTIVRRREFPKN